MLMSGMACPSFRALGDPPASRQRLDPALRGLVTRGRLPRSRRSLRLGRPLGGGQGGRARPQRRRPRMKRRTTRTTDPLDSEVDFDRFGPPRRNAFAGANERGGPSLLALWEMPELGTDAVPLRRG